MQSEIESLLRKSNGEFSKSGKAYLDVLSSMESYTSPHLFISDAYSSYERQPGGSQSINGSVFEHLVCETMTRAGIRPFYCQAQFALVPNTNFDVVCYDPTSPVALSMKVSLRERWKQADLEGMALRQVYRRAKNYLITLDKKKANNIKRKIRDGTVGGLNACICADTGEYEDLLEELKQRKFIEGREIMPITARSSVP